MRKSKSLSFEGQQKKNSKRFRSFIIAFCAFVLVLGSVSLLMFMKHLDFDLDNLVSTSAVSTTESIESTSQPVQLQGTSQILLICESQEHQLEYAFLVSTDYSQNSMTVYTLPSDISFNYGNFSGSPAECYDKLGAIEFKKAVEGALSIKADRFICFGESKLRSFLNKFEDVSVNIEKDIDEPQTGLILNAGEQSLSTEIFLKYMHYADDYHKADAFAQFLKVVFAPSHSVKLESLFSFIANNSQTDITIVDFKARQDNLIAFTKGEQNIYAVASNAGNGGDNA